MDAERGNEQEKIVVLALDHEPSTQKRPEELYGDGKAGDKIAGILNSREGRR